MDWEQQMNDITTVAAQVDQVFDAESESVGAELHEPDFRKPSEDLYLSTSSFDPLFADVPDVQGEKQAYREMADGRLSFRERGKVVGELVDAKNKVYGDSFSKSGEILKLLYPDGVKPEQLHDMLTIARVVDKLFRIATAKDALGESPWQDITGYGLLALGKV
jgi:hypothetical protein